MAESIDIQGEVPPRIGKLDELTNPIDEETKKRLKQALGNLALAAAIDDSATARRRYDTPRSNSADPDADPDAE